MQAGRLKYVITFKKKTVVTDEFNAKGVTWNDFFSVPAALKYNGGKRTTDNHEEFNTKGVVFEVRFNPSINEDLRILFEGKLYEIESIDPLGYRDGMSITANLLNA